MLIVIDGVSKEPIMDVTVSIAAGKIVDIQNKSLKTFCKCHYHRSSGKWLLPGYIDAHVPY
jgi:imidazolonepropionase-like amidohydrolase